MDVCFQLLVPVIEHKQASFRYSVLCTVESLSLLYLFYVLGDDAWIAKGSFMQTNHLCVLIHI